MVDSSCSDLIHAARAAEGDSYCKTCGQSLTTSNTQRIGCMCLFSVDGERLSVNIMCPVCNPQPQPYMLEDFENDDMRIEKTPDDGNAVYTSGEWGKIELDYHRKGAITFSPSGKCDVCKRDEIPVLCVDGSEGEYGEICICERCVLDAFKNDSQQR